MLSPNYLKIYQLKNRLPNKIKIQDKFYVFYKKLTNLFSGVREGKGILKDMERMWFTILKYLKIGNVKLVPH